MVPQIISKEDAIREGKKYIYPDLHNYWETYVNYNFNSDTKFAFSRAIIIMQEIANNKPENLDLKKLYNQFKTKRFIWIPQKSFLNKSYDESYDPEEFKNASNDLLLVSEIVLDFGKGQAPNFFRAYLDDDDHSIPAPATDNYRSFKEQMQAHIDNKLLYNTFLEKEANSKTSNQSFKTELQEHSKKIDPAVDNLSSELARFSLGKLKINDEPSAFKNAKSEIIPCIQHLMANGLNIEQAEKVLIASIEHIKSISELQAESNQIVEMITTPIKNNTIYSYSQTKLSWIAKVVDSKANSSDKGYSVETAIDYLSLLASGTEPTEVWEKFTNLLNSCNKKERHVLVSNVPDLMLEFAKGDKGTAFYRRHYENYFGEMDSDNQKKLEEIIARNKKIEDELSKQTN